MSVPPAAGGAKDLPTIDQAGDRGTVTVEAALALCSLMVVLALVLAAVSAVTAQLRCVDAAREAARLTARGEQDRAKDLARRIAPRGAAVEVTVRGDEITARVSADPVAGLLPGIKVGAEAVAVLEPGAT
ncbi:MAG: TadE family type IV pilus minor pilin [Pseudonocardiaceae bacterium]